MQIVRNLSIDFLRRDKVKTQQEIVELAGEAPQEAHIERLEMRERIDFILQQLPEHYRELIGMRDIQGLSPQDIAEIIDVDYGTTRWRIHQARKHFRKHWIEHFGEELS